MLIYKAFGWVNLIQNLTFSIRNSFKIQAFFLIPSWASFFHRFTHFNAKRFDFGRPLTPKWNRNGGLNRRSGAKRFQKTIPRIPKSYSCAPCLGDLDWTVSQGPFRSAPWHHFGCFCVDLGWIKGGFVVDFRWIRPSLF